MRSITKILFCALIILFCGCSNRKVKKNYQKADPTTVLYNQLKEEMTDEFCKSVIKQALQHETKQNVDLSESVIKIKRYPSEHTSIFEGEGFFEGKINKKKGDYYFTIKMKNNNYRRIKDSTAWNLGELIIKPSGSLNRVFIAGENVMTTGDYIYIDGIKITMAEDAKHYQKFVTSSRLTKEQIMKLKDCRERKKVGIMYLYLKGNQKEYAQYIDGMNALFMYSPDRMYEVEKTAYTYKFHKINM